MKKSAPSITEESVPQAPESEQAILSACLDSDQAILEAAALIGIEDFHSPAHRKTFKAILDLHGKRRTVDPITLKVELTEAGELETVGGAAFIGRLVDAPCGRASVREHAEAIREKARKRRLMEKGLSYVAACRNGHTAAELTEAGAELYREALAVDPEAARRCKTVDTLLSDYSESVSSPKLRKVRTGLWSLDDATDGIAPGEVLTIVARPQVGKSAIACQMIVNGAAEGVPAVFFSLEMPREQALERLMQAAMGLTRHQVEGLGKSGFKGLSPTQLAALESIRRCIAIVDRGKSSIADLDASMHEAAAILGRQPRLAVIDFLGLLGSGARNVALYQRVSEASIDVKSFAKRHHVAVILLSQAGRDHDEARSEGADHLSIDAARDSGQVEENADFLMTLWRPELRSTLNTEERAAKRGQLKGHLVKNRRGPLPRLHFQLDAPTLRIHDVAAGEEA